MLVKEDFFDDNKETIINNNDSSEDFPDIDKDYQFTIEIKFNLNVDYDSIKSFDNSDTIYQETNRLFKYIERKYDILLSINKHITDYRLSELVDTSHYNTLFNTLSNNNKIQCYTLTIDFDLVPFKNKNELFYFFDSLCFENYRFKSNQNIRCSTQRFTIYKDKKLIDILCGEVTFNKILNSEPLITEMIKKNPLLTEITENKPNKINEDFFDDNQVLNDIEENPSYDSLNPEQPIYDYTMEILFYPGSLKNWNDNYVVMDRLNYILESNNHIKEHSKPILCTDYTEKIINDYLKTHKDILIKEIRLLKTHYDEYTIIDRKTSKDSVGDQIMNPFFSIHYIKFTFSHSFTKPKQLINFYTSIYNTVLKYMKPKIKPKIGIIDNNTKRFKAHTSISPVDLFSDNGIDLEAQRLFDFMIPNYDWQHLM